ncbi:MAG: M50 family metallopeptidase [Christensenellales bacterium]
MRAARSRFRRGDRARLAGAVRAAVRHTALVNLNLAVFNLIPLPPLDGYHVVNDLIFKGRFQLSQNAFRIGMMIVLVLSAQGFRAESSAGWSIPRRGCCLRRSARFGGKRCITFPSSSLKGRSTCCCI